MPHDELGREIPDPTPVEVPLGYRRPEPLNQLIKRLVRTELSQQAELAGEDTWEEADDFDMDDEDPDPLSEYELRDMDEEFDDDYTVRPEPEPEPPSKTAPEAPTSSQDASKPSTP